MTTDFSFPQSESVQPRHSFMPPVIQVTPLPRPATVPALTELMGETIVPNAATIQVGWSPEGLTLQAKAESVPTVLDPDLPPDHPDFWRQEHIDLHLVRPDGEMRQFILTPDGRVMDSAGHWRERDRLKAHGTVHETAWDAELFIPWTVLGVETPALGLCLRAQLAHMRWHGPVPDFAVFSTTPLGFNQRERFGVLRLSDAACPVALAGARPAEGDHFPEGDHSFELTLFNHGDAATEGRLLLRAEETPQTPAPSSSQPLTLTPGAHTKTVKVKLERPRYTRYTVCWQQGNSVQTLGALTLRAAVPEAPELSNLAHPYLVFDAKGLDALRARITDPQDGDPIIDPVFRVQTMKPQDEDLTGASLPKESPAELLKLNHSSIGWYHVGKANFNAPSGGTMAPKAAYIWSRLPKDAQEAWKAIQLPADATDERIAPIMAALNDLLERRDFYKDEFFGDMPLLPEAAELLERGIDSLSATELLWLNRFVMQCSLTNFSRGNLHLVGRASNLGLQFVVSGDKRLIATATQYVKLAADVMVPGPYMDLGEGGSGRLALAYDVFAPHLSAEDRAHWLRLLERFLDLHLRASREQHWNCVATPNANPVCNSAGGLLALALWNERPEKAREALRYARKFIWNWVDYCNGPDGGNTEGCQYWQYGGDAFYRFALALEHVTGSDDGFLMQPNIRRHMNMIRVALSNDGCLHGINDTIPLPKGAPIAWLHANLYDDPFALWYGDHAARVYAERQQAGRKTPQIPSGLTALLYRPKKPIQPTAPSLPTCMVMHDIEYAVLRSEPRWDCRLVAFMKGSRPPYTHHNQPDTGAFSVHVRGERMLIDPGYFKGAPDCHCLPIIDGVAPTQPDAWVGHFIDHGEVADLRRLVCDVTPAYPGAAGKVIRHLVMVGHEGLVLLDEIEPPEGRDGIPVVAQYQAGGETELSDTGRGVRIQGQKSCLKLELFGPDAVALTCQPERDLNDVHWGYHFADCRHFPVTATYKATVTAPLVTVITDTTEDVKGEARCDLAAKRLTVTMPSERQVRFAKLQTGWRLDAG